MKTWREAALGLVALSSVGCATECPSEADNFIQYVVGLGPGECEPEPSSRLDGLGDLPGGVEASAAYDTSADGALVVGASWAEAGSTAVVWSSQTGLVALEGGRGAAYAVDDAGQTVVGTALDPAGVPSAARWRGSLEPDILSFPPLFQIVFGEAAAVSGDGRVAAGHVLQLGAGPIGTVWTEGAPPRSEPNGAIQGASFDGSVLVGYTERNRSNPWSYALRNSVPLPYPFVAACTEAGCEPLPCASPFSCEARALDVSADGAIVVGGATRLEGDLRVAVQWHVSADGSVVTTILPGESPAQALAVSGDGRVVVGYQTVAGQRVATRWIDGTPISVASALAEAGVSLDGWSLTIARGTSPDGSVIVGEGINPLGQPEGWRAILR